MARDQTDVPVDPEQQPPLPAPVPPARQTPAPIKAPRYFLTDLSHPFSKGLAAGLGVLTAIGIAAAAASLATVWVYIGVALFLAMALDPLVRWLQRKGMSRLLAISAVFAVFALVFAALLAIVLPVAVTQLSDLARAIPGWIDGVQNSQWLDNLLAATGSEATVDAWLDQIVAYLSNPTNLMAIAGGALAVGSGIVSGATGVMFVLILTLYFTATLGELKAALSLLAPAYARRHVTEITDHITSSVGAYISGMFILAVCNSVVAFILLTALGVPFAPLLAAVALVVTMIPMVGSVLFWLIASTVCLFQSWSAALIFALVYFAYMQLEAYLMTPRVMAKQVEVPGSVVIVSALIGGSLLGLLGALIAVPVAATLLMIIERLYVPRQDKRTVPPPDSAFT